MNLNKQSLAILEDLLQKDCSNITIDDLKSMLNNELEKPAKLINSRLVHVLLDLLEPTSIRGMQTDLSFSELADMIESDIAMRTFVNSDGDPYQFETVCDDIAFLMVEQYEKSGRSNPFEIKLIRDTAKKGEAALYIVIATLFQNTLDDTILGAVEGACDYLLVADDLIDGMTGEDLEIQAELADLHMNTIEQLIHYAEMGKCANVNELKKHAFTAKKWKDHIDLIYRTKGM